MYVNELFIFVKFFLLGINKCELISNCWIFVNRCFLNNVYLWKYKRFELFFLVIFGVNLRKVWFVFLFNKKFILVVVVNFGGFLEYCWFFVVKLIL